MMEKLELKHLAPYLPYGLKGEYNIQDVNKDYKFELRHKILASDSVDFFEKFCKPILRPLSDLTKEIEVNGERFVPLQHFCKKWDAEYYIDNLEMTELNDFESHVLKIANDIEVVSYDDAENLFEWHFDIFGLIKQGLAIDINTLKETV